MVRGDSLLRRPMQTICSCHFCFIKVQCKEEAAIETPEVFFCKLKFLGFSFIQPPGGDVYNQMRLHRSRSTCSSVICEGLTCRMLKGLSKIRKKCLPPSSSFNAETNHGGGGGGALSLEEGRHVILILGTEM